MIYFILGGCIVEDQGKCIIECEPVWMSSSWESTSNEGLEIGQTGPCISEGQLPSFAWLPSRKWTLFLFFQLVFLNPLNTHRSLQIKKPSYRLSHFSSPLIHQDPNRCGPSDRSRLIVPRGRPHHRSSADASILPLQQRGLPGWRGPGGGGTQAPRGVGGLNPQLLTILSNHPAQLMNEMNDVTYSFLLLKFQWEGM